jgi:hypothetical protein
MNAAAARLLLLLLLLLFSHECCCFKATVLLLLLSHECCRCSRSGIEDYHHHRPDYAIHVRQQARQRWREEKVTGWQHQRKDHRQPVDTHRTIRGQG